MRKIFGIIVLLLITAYSNIIAQNDINAVKQEISILQAKQKKSELNIRELTRKNISLEVRIQKMKSDYDSLERKSDSLENVCKDITNIQKSNKETLSNKIDKTRSDVEEVLSNRTLWGICSVLVILIVISTIVYCVMKKVKKDSTSIVEVRKVQDALSKAQTKMQEESIKLDNKLLEIAERQISEQKTNASLTGDKSKVDHSLALKVADEIVRIEMNLSRMDPSVKGYKQLSKAVQRIKDNFSANGYEIVDMLGKPYNEGMKVVANFVPDDTLAEGKQIITGIIKPQINYHGVMIQSAQITVSQNI